MDVVIVMIILGCVVFFFKRTFSGFVYAVGAVDIFLRLLAFLKIKLLSGEISAFINSYLPESIPSLINKYTNGGFNTFLIWVYVGIMVVFEFYIIRTFIKKR